MVTSTAQDKSDDFVIFYASQTGNAEWIAKNILQEARERGFQGEVYVMNDHEKVRAVMRKRPASCLGRSHQFTRGLFRTILLFS